MDAQDLIDEVTREGIYQELSEEKWMELRKKAEEEFRFSSDRYITH